MDKIYETPPEWDKNFDEVIAAIKKCAGGQFRDYSKDSWQWPRNSDCKYVQILVDMRDGAFVLKDRHGKRITLADMMKQSGEPWPKT